jgi:hypothetical protein
LVHGLGRRSLDGPEIICYKEAASLLTRRICFTGVEADTSQLLSRMQLTARRLFVAFSKAGSGEP